MRRVAIIGLVLGLLVGTAAAFAVTEALKLERSPVTRPRFDGVISPVCRCETEAATLSFRLRRADRLDLTIVDGDMTVRTLSEDLVRTRGPVSIEWDGKDDSGAIVPDGRYRLRVDLAYEGRAIVIPREITVDTRAPEFEIVYAGPTTISPDDDGRRDEVRILYRASEDVGPRILVNGRVAVELPVRREREQTVVWDGRLAGRRAEEGSYRVSIQVRDRAENLSDAVDALTAEVRYVDVVPDVIVARRGGRLGFRILTDAARVSWRLRRPHGRVLLADAHVEAGPVAVQLPGRIRPGRYVLQVVANGHRERAVVRVTKRRR